METSKKTNTILGIDLGSRNVKLCLMRNAKIEKRDCIETMSFYREYGTNSDEKFIIDLDALGFPSDTSIIATGYGRMAASLGGAANVSELTAHFVGARHQTGIDDFTLLDMGGQDYKVMHVKNGRLVDMATNDKCAASTGRYLENMARVLGMTIKELSSFKEKPVPLSSTCAIFGESELIGMVVKGKSVERLAAGVNRVVVERVLPLLERMGEERIVMSGGVALNEAVVSILADETGREIIVLDDPLYNGAIGCCIKGA